MHVCVSVCVCVCVLTKIIAKQPHQSKLVQLISVNNWIELSSLCQEYVIINNVMSQGLDRSSAWQSHETRRFLFIYLLFFVVAAAAAAAVVVVAVLIHFRIIIMIIKTEVKTSPITRCQMHKKKSQRGKTRVKSADLVVTGFNKSRCDLQRSRETKAAHVTNILDFFFFPLWNFLF